MAPPALSPLMQWRRIEALVGAWLEQRQQLIVRLCALQGLEGLDDARPRSVQSRVGEFCQLLMDYISAGYFEVYRELVREARRYQETPDVAGHILRELDQSTEEALAFNEDFDSDDHCLGQLQQLPERLNRLTEVLEERFALEDQLILSVHQAPRRHALRH
ncbi:sigma D regulator [Alloalcanivorax gelatiniphagus]|mgnify:CR=1 FL=1|uniref:Sigma D regulator n=1 Tax=Alloalcanivorax gelatiniphagus TaxID=1194167 RepID=A0ABY2XLG0_9GAMM|nr:sigma D regulator [Alloalcanivorax gelatiniphagus]TMW12335.1 sigma D regulator [Alloalcanivorax gelatiniphagus]